MASLRRTLQLYRYFLSAQIRLAHSGKLTSSKSPGAMEHSTSKNYSTTMLSTISPSRKLFTPNTLNVSDRVKQAMMEVDPGSRHAEFAYTVKFVRNALLQIAKVNEDEYTAIPLDGSGAFATEATLRTMLKNTKGKLLILENGLYGRQLALVCRSSGINVKVIPMNMKTLQDTMLSMNDVAGVISVHCETSTGIINPISEIGMIVKKCSPDCLYFVDAMTSFGAIDIDMKNIDFLMSNSCKSLQGVPGVSFVIAKKKQMEMHLNNKGDSLVLDIGSQYEELEKTGEFRFTPPTHVMLALKEALLEYSDEGGLEGRAKRYKENNKILKEEMSKMGFKQLYKDEENPQGYFLTAFVYPNNPLFVFEEFYNRLCDKGHVISSERMNSTNCFRISNIGDVYPDDVRDLVESIRDVLQDMRIEVPLQEDNF